MVHIPAEKNNGILKILVSSAGSKIPLIAAVSDAAKRIDKQTIVVAGDIDKECLAAWYAEAFWHMPPCAPDYLDDIVSACQEQGINMVIPTRDEELLFWSQNRDRFTKQGIHLIVPAHESIMRCYDKLQFSHYGQEQALPVIPSAEHIGDIDAARFVVKERYGSSKSKVMLNLSGADAQQSAENYRHPIYQPCISGTEISADAWLDTQHRVKGIVLRTRDKICHTEACVTTTFQDEGLAQQLTIFLERLMLTGHVVTQLIIDERGKIHIIECNTRFGGASTISIKAGLDSFYWSLIEHISGSVAHIPYIPITSPIRQLRIPSDHYITPGS